MPYVPINKCLSSTEDIRLQHRYASATKDLSRKTHFNKQEIQRLIQLHYMLTTKQNRTMDQSCFAEFMDTFLGFRETESIEKIHALYCEPDRAHLTAEEFVRMLSLLLKGTLPALIAFCFTVYKKIVKSSPYIQKDDVLMVARRNSQRMRRTISVEEYDQNFVEYIMDEMDVDKDNRISFDDYRAAVNENVTRLQFLGPVIPSSENAERFMNMFTTRPYVNKIDIVMPNQEHEGTQQLSMALP